MLSNVYVCDEDFITKQPLQCAVSSAICIVSYYLYVWCVTVVIGKADGHVVYLDISVIVFLFSSRALFFHQVFISNIDDYILSFLRGSFINYT